MIKRYEKNEPISLDRKTKNDKNYSSHAVNHTSPFTSLHNAYGMHHMWLNVLLIHLLYSVIFFVRSDAM